MSRSEANPPLLRSALRELLDEQLDARCMDYSEALKIPIECDLETDELIPETFEPADVALMEVVFIADARAQSINSDYTIVNQVAWVGFARKSLRRVAKNIESIGGLDRTRMFSDGQTALQADAYKDMHDLRGAVRGGPLNQWTGLDYAARVASGEIALVEPVIIEDYAEESVF